jgi:putative transposase
MPWYHHYPRLPITNYSGKQAYFITICCHNRRAHFKNADTGHTALEILKQAADKQHFLLHAYSLLPDHLHFLAEGRDEQSHLTEFVKLFKQRSAYYQRFSTPDQLWQNRFYDHILRHADSMLDVACYIWMNPVRSRLCAGPREYPLSGSQTIDWMKMKEIASSWTPPWKDTQAGLKSGTYRTKPAIP